MKAILDIILMPFYIFRGWLIYTIVDSGTIIYNKNTKDQYYVIEDRIVLKRGSKILTTMNYYNTGKLMSILLIDND
ncbi:MAG: hypothetical protein J6D03_01125 [Clostridia bacterium]|nr:hypothetical protein [Clostridia bacterium]